MFLMSDGGATKPDDMVDITEYAHTSMPGVCRFFGTFAAKENEHYDAGTKGSLKFVRHKGIKCAAILHACKCANMAGC